MQQVRAVCAPACHGGYEHATWALNAPPAVQGAARPSVQPAEPIPTI